MALGRVVPWADWEEWEEVRTGIFSEDLTLRRAAVDRVNAWEARGKLPLGAEITACLHELRMRDQGLSGTAGMADQPRSEPESLLRLQYAMLVIRLVNGISDSSQKGRVAMSVANLAEDAGIPRILVDVRHDASHNELPSLSLLRLASSAALSWLHSAYWQRQADHLQSCRAHISSLLQRYTELQRAAILKQAVTGKVEEEDSAAVVVADAQADATAYSGAIGQKQRREVVAEIWERVHAAAHLLVGPLLDNGLLEAQEDACGRTEQGGCFEESGIDAAGAEERCTGGAQ
ncbi:hypothetical protein WJX75_006664 [Coccomyxa subellipsoidea]|uniref:Las1-domain-containing protein n=1 Tax=Coccomyxa subellipsoidea TaxID=248742 RepID=A0ABR2YJX0_9CHLO